MHTELAPAKLTVSLRVTGRRPDGYHLLDAEMVSLDLADELTFHPSEGPDSSLEIPPPEGPGATGSGGPGTSVPTASPAAGRGLPPERLMVPTGGENLVLKALRAVDRTAHVRLRKRVPPGGGLGGGSADAAAVFRWAGCDDVVLAASLGADVPFCLRGGRARVTGIGDQLVPLPFEERVYTLVLPPFGCSTPAVYRVWDEMGGPGGDSANDLQAAALRVEPRLAEWRDQLGEATGKEPVLAGSGSTWFVPGAHPGPGRIVTCTTPAFPPPHG